MTCRWDDQSTTWLTTSWFVSKLSAYPTIIIITIIIIIIIIIIIHENSRKQANDIYRNPNYIKPSYASPVMILWSKFAP